LRLHANDFAECGERKNYLTSGWMEKFIANRFQDFAQNNALDIAGGRKLIFKFVDSIIYDNLIIKFIFFCILFTARALFRMIVRKYTLLKNVTL